MAFRVRVLAFDNGGDIPSRYGRDGANVSPAVEWEDIPSGTKSLALVMDDPDAPAGVWTHWILWNLPATQTALAEGWQPGLAGMAGMNDFGEAVYDGPQPPRGHGPHRYFLKLYALDTPKLLLGAGSKRWEFDKALRGHVIDEAWYMGKFERLSEAVALGG